MKQDQENNQPGNEEPGENEPQRHGELVLGIGDRFGDCTIVSLLGSGAMGQVYLVQAPNGRKYALTILHPEFARHNTGMKRRFLNEAEFAMTIRHRNLVEVRDAGEEPGKGLCYMLMEYMPGGSLKGMIEREGALPIERAISYVSQIAYALALAHRNGVIHRDIKPDNILFTADGVPKLSDLGIAKFISDTQTSTLTMKGHILGTPAYMAPEQMMDSHHIDARADIYSLGVVLYEMLTGKKPNAGSTLMGLLTKAIKGEPLPDVRKMRPEVSTSVAYVLSLMCAPKPEDRPMSTSVVADLLSRANVDGLILPDVGGQQPPPPERNEEPKPSIFSRFFGQKK